MLIRVLSRGLFFRRGSQVDFTGGPLGNRQANAEGINVVHSVAGNVAETDAFEGGPYKTSPPKVAQAIRTEDPGVENYPVIPDAVSSRPENAQYIHPSIIDNSSHVSSCSTHPYAFGNGIEAVMKGTDEGDDADEVFRTPLHQTPFLGQEDGSSTKLRFIEHFDDTPCPSKTPSPSGPPDIPIMDTRLTQGVLSDIAEADESGVQDLSTQDLKPSPNLLRVRTLSFSSFGSSYPSSCFGSPALNGALPCGMTTTCAGTFGHDATLSASSSSPLVGWTHSAVQLASHDIGDSARRPPSPDSPTSDFVPFVVEPLLSSNSVVRLAVDEGVVDERKDGHEADVAPMPTTATTSVVPSASTYADATNLALQHPEMASDILRQPLSSASASGCPSKLPTPSVSCSVSLQMVPPVSSSCTPMRAGTPHTAERPNWALAPDVQTSDRPALTVASRAHAVEDPNWALAKETTGDRRPRSRSRGRGRGGTRPSSVTRAFSRGAELQTRRGGRSCDASQAKLTPTVTTSDVVSPKHNQESECGDALQGVPSRVADFEDGPQQWLNRVNSWVEQTSQERKTCPGTPDCDPDAKCTNILPPSPKEPTSRLQCHSRTASGLNPHAPVWTPTPRARCQTPTDSDSAPPATQSESSPSANSARGPFTFGVDADIDRLRDMLRNCGIQDKDADAGSIRDDKTRSTPPGLEKNEYVAPDDKGSQKTKASCEMNEADKIPGHFNTGDIFSSQSDAPQQGFEFTTPTCLGPPISIAGPMSGRTSPFPQSFLTTPPRLAFQRSNAQYFRKEPGGPWISGYFEPNAPSSGPPFFPQAKPGPALFPTPAAGSPHLSFSQTSRSFSRTCQPSAGGVYMQGSPQPFVPGSYKVHVNCAERGRDAVPDAPASPFTVGMKRPRQPTIGPSTFKSQRFV